MVLLSIFFMIERSPVKSEFWLSRDFLEILTSRRFSGYDDAFGIVQITPNFNRSSGIKMRAVAAFITEPIKTIQT